MKNIQIILTVLLLVGGAYFIVYLVNTYELTKRAHELNHVSLEYTEEGKPYLLLKYNYSVGNKFRRKRTSYKTLDLGNGQILGEKTYKQVSYNEKFNFIHLKKKIFVFEKGESNFHYLSLPSLEEALKEEKSEDLIKKVNPEITSIYSLKLNLSSLQLTSKEGYEYWLSLEDLSRITKKEAQEAQKKVNQEEYTRKNGYGFWKDQAGYQKAENWIYLAAGKEPPKKESSIQIEIIESPENPASTFALNYAVVDSSSYRVFVLEGNNRRHLLEVFDKGLTKKIQPGKEYIRGELLRPYRKKGRTPTVRWAILPSNPKSAFILHRSEMDESKSHLLLTKVQLDDGKEVWQLDLSQLYGLEGSDHPTYNWLLGDRLICLFRSQGQSRLFCFDVKNGKLLWSEDI